MGTWLQLELETHQSQAKTICELLTQFGATAISFSAASDEAVFDQQDSLQADDPEIETLWHRTKLTALLHPDSDLDIMLACLQRRVGSENLYRHQIKPIKEKNWVQQFEATHQPLIIANRICISPSWCDTKDIKLPTIILDPGLAFGTGAHATTALCIEWLAKHDLNNKIVIDYGCGSSVLAMVAASLGAKQVYAVDIDPQAINVANDNIQRNQLAAKIQTGLVDHIPLPIADIVVANILMEPLKKLVSTFSKLIKKDGDLILSGLLYSQAEECLAIYSHSFKMDPPIFDLEWSRLHGIRK